MLGADIFMFYNSIFYHRVQSYLSLIRKEREHFLCFRVLTLGTMPGKNGGRDLRREMS